MCTVTYIPRTTGFILTHNRDEAPSRSPQTIVREQTPGGDTLIFPRDTMAGGTWIATSRNGRTACLLNGAFVLHTRELPYRRSRGLILLDFFDWESPDAFFQEYNLDRVEPFTFLFFERSARVIEFRWDGQKRHFKELSPDEPHFWCSATLYPKEMQVRREQVFKEWLRKQPFHLANSLSENQPGSRALIQLHLTGSVGDPENDYVMNRAGRVQTVSVTQVVVDEKKAQMRYLDLLGGNRNERRLSHSKRGTLTVNR